MPSKKKKKKKKTKKKKKKSVSVSARVYREHLCHHTLASSCPSVRMEQAGSHWTDFQEIWHLCIFQKSVKEFQVLLKSDENIGYFTWRPTYIFGYNVFRWDLLRVRNVQTTVLEEIKTHFIRQLTLFRKSCRLWDNEEKHRREGQATANNMAHAHCMLDN